MAISNTAASIVVINNSRVALKELEKIRIKDNDGNTFTCVQQQDNELICVKRTKGEGIALCVLIFIIFSILFLFVITSRK